MTKATRLLSILLVASLYGEDAPAAAPEAKPAETTSAKMFVLGVTDSSYLYVTKNLTEDSSEPVIKYKIAGMYAPKTEDVRFLYDTARVCNLPKVGLMIEASRTTKEGLKIIYFPPGKDVNFQEVEDRKAYRIAKIDYPKLLEIISAGYAVVDIEDKKYFTEEEYSNMLKRQNVAQKDNTGIWGKHKQVMECYKR